MKEFFLRTKRIFFSTWDEDDLTDALDLWGDPEVTKFISANGRMTEEEARRRLEKEINAYHEHGIQYWPIYLVETGKHMGCCGLRPYDPGRNIVELGIHLKKEYWGKGYAFEACKAVIGYAFNVLQAEGIFTGHNPKNTASAGLIKKLDFTYTHDEFYPPTGLKHPSYLLTKQEYLILRAAEKP